MSLLRIYSIMFSIILFCGCQTARVPQPNFSPTDPHIKILSYNVNNGFRESWRVFDFIAASDADIVCLQGTDKYWQKTLSKQFFKRYPCRVFKEWSGAGGVALMSKHDVKNIRFLPPGPGWYPALLVDVVTPSGDVQVLNVNLSPPVPEGHLLGIPVRYTTPENRIEQIRGFLARTDLHQPLIVTGEFNEEDDNIISRWMARNGLYDSLSQYDSGVTPGAWSNLGATIPHRHEHLLYSRHFKCTGARLTKIQASDHYPIEAVVVMR